MTREQDAAAAVKLLTNVFAEDINATAKIINAHSEVLEGNENGYKTIIEALDALIEFIQKLANNLDEKNGDPTLPYP